MLGSATPDGLRAALASGNPYSWAHQVPPRDLVPATIATQAALYSMGAAATLQAFGSYMPSVEGRCVVLLGQASQPMQTERPGADPGASLRSALEAAGILGPAAPSAKPLLWRASTDPSDLVQLTEAAFVQLRRVELELTVTGTFMAGSSRAVVTVVEDQVRHALRLAQAAGAQERRAQWSARC